MRSRTLAAGAALGAATLAISAPAALAAPFGTFRIDPSRVRPVQQVRALTDVCVRDTGFVTSPALNTIRVTRTRGQRFLVGRGFVRRVRPGDYRVTLTCAGGRRAYTTIRVVR
jgi:hypothetical protein